MRSFFDVWPKKLICFVFSPCYWPFNTNLPLLTWPSWRSLGNSWVRFLDCPQVPLGFFPYFSWVDHLHLYRVHCVNDLFGILGTCCTCHYYKISIGLSPIFVGSNKCQQFNPFLFQAHLKLVWIFPSDIVVCILPFM